MKEYQLRSVRLKQLPLCRAAWRRVWLDRFSTKLAKGYCAVEARAILAPGVAEVDAGAMRRPKRNEQQLGGANKQALRSGATKRAAQRVFVRSERGGVIR